MQQKYQIVVSATGKGIRNTTRQLNEGFTRGKRALAAFNAAAGRTQQVTKGLPGLLKQFVVASGLGGGGLGYLAKQSLSAMEALNTMSRTTGIATDRIQELQFAANQAGVSQEKINDALQEMSQRMGEAVADAKRNGGRVTEMGEGFEAAGLSMQKLEKMTPTAVFDRVSRAIEEAKNEQVALNLAVKVFGDEAGRSMVAMLREGEKSLDEYIDKAHKLGLVIDEDMIRRSTEARKNLGTLMYALRSQFQVIVADLAPAISEMATRMTEWISVNKEFLRQEVAAKIKKIVPVVVEWIKWAGELLWKWKKLIIAVVGIQVVLVPLKTVVGLVRGLNAAFAVMTGMGIIKWVGSLRLALNTLSKSATAAGIAVKGAAAAGAAWGVVKIYEAIKAYREMRAAQKEAAEAWERTEKIQDKALKSLDKFKDAKLPDDITGRNVEELKKFKWELFRAGLYYSTLKDKLEKKAEETTWLGGASDDAMEAKQELSEVKQRLQEIRADKDKLEDVMGQTAEGMKKPAKAVMATAEQLEKFEKQARETYEYARSQAEKYADKVVEYEEKIKNARMSTADKIRELQRKGLSEQEQWNDKRLQADEKMMAARQALRENDYDRAKKLADDAQRLYADLATEVTAKRDGEDVVVKSIDETKKVAVAGVKEAGQVVEQLYEKQKESAEKSQAKWEATADKIEEKLEWVARARETDVEIKLPNLSSVQSAINDLVKDETKHITVVETRQVKTEEQKAGGGRVGMNHGGRLPGFGGGDRIRALLEAGEFVIRKEAVKKYGSALFEALNSMRLPKLSSPAMKFAAGGSVPSAGEVMTVNFRAGGVEMPLRVMGNRGSTRDQIRQFDAELKKMGLARG